MVSGTDFVKATIAEHSVVVFSKTYCPYCDMAKQVLNSVGAEYFVVELDTIDDFPSGDDIQNACHQLTGQRTVPNVFINGTSIGGGSETRALHSAGKLVPLLKAAGAV